MSIDGWSLRFWCTTKTASTSTPPAIGPTTWASVKSASWPPLMIP